MADPTLEFDLISFPEVAATLYFTRRIRATALNDAVILARTSQGNFAKLQIVPGRDLRITRLTVYDGHGCLIKTASDLTIRNGFGCDLAHAAETTTTPDFWWHEVTQPFPFPPGAPRQFYIESHPQRPASFHVYKGFDEVTYADVSAAEYTAGRVEAQALARQIIYCRTGAGRFAKLLVEAGTALTIRRLVVYADDHTVRLDRSNITLAPNSTIDLDTGNVMAAGVDREAADLWWLTQAAIPVGTGSTQRFLAPGRGAAISFASYFRMLKYEPLLRSAPIRTSLIWVDAAGTRAFDNWRAEEKLHLREFLYLREIGQDFPIAGPPPLNAGIMSPCDAWKIYLAHVAQSFWVDANARVSWRLSGASPEHLTQLFDMTKLIKYAGGHKFDVFVMGYITPWCPVIAYDFLVESEFIGVDQWTTITALVRWCGANLIHISTGETEEYLYGYHGYAPVDKMIYPLPGRRHVTEGCWGTDGFLAAVLRSVNIPVRHGRTNFSGGTHSRPEFFSVGQNLTHGDDPYNSYVKPGHHNVPIERIFYDNATLAAEIDNPTPLPGRTVAETASFNSGRRMANLGVEYLTDYLLISRCIDQRTGRTGTTSELWGILHDYYTDAQIDAIAAQCDAFTATIPRGCTSFFFP